MFKVVYSFITVYIYIYIFIALKLYIIIHLYIYILERSACQGRGLGPRAPGPHPGPQGTPRDPALGPGTTPSVSQWPVSGAGPPSIRRPRCEIPRSPGRPLLLIYE